MPPDSSAPAPQPEIDLYWGGASARFLLPHLILTAMFMWSAVAILPPVLVHLGCSLDWGRYIVGQSAVMVGTAVAVVCLYRGACFMYRLTPTRLIIDYGFLFHRIPTVPIASITTVRVSRGIFGRFFDSGTIHLGTTSGVVRLVGVSRPASVARLIDEVRRLAKQPAIEPQAGVTS